MVIYAEYIKSRQWKATAALYRKERKYTCEICGGKGTDIHHITYAHLGDELNHPEDVLLLCRSCHTYIHEPARTHGEYDRPYYLGIHSAVGYEDSTYTLFVSKQQRYIKGIYLPTNINVVFVDDNNYAFSLEEFGRDGGSFENIKFGIDAVGDLCYSCMCVGLDLDPFLTKQQIHDFNLELHDIQYVTPEEHKKIHHGGN